MPQPAQSHIPPGAHSITLHLCFSGNAKEALEFYQRAFGARLIGRAMMGHDDKSVMHAMLAIGDSQFAVADGWPSHGRQGPSGHTTASVWLYVPDCDAAFNKARAAGCLELMALHDAFWGDRFGSVIDPFGHHWTFATNKFVLTDEELGAAQKAFLQRMAAQREWMD